MTRNMTFCLCAKQACCLFCAVATGNIPVGRTGHRPMFHKVWTEHQQQHRKSRRQSGKLRMCRWS